MTLSFCGRTLTDYLPRRSAFSQVSHLQPDYPNSPGYPVHGKRTDLQKACAECFHTFQTNSHLEQHASSSGHNAFSCICGAQFSRAYTLTRHINSMIGTGFPCGLCDDKSFPRLDKLADHLRKWHRLGGKAFDQYKGGKASCDSVSPLSDRNPLATSEGATPFYPQQMYSMAPGFGPVTMFNDFPPVSDTEPGTPSGESSGSPGSATVSSNILVFTQSTGFANAFDPGP